MSVRFSVFGVQLYSYHGTIASSENETNLLRMTPAANLLQELKIWDRKLATENCF